MLDIIHDRVNFMQEREGDCILCQRMTRDVGVFHPFKGSVYDNDHPTKVRFYLYYLCDDCMHRPRSAEEVENKIFMQIVIGFQPIGNQQ